ncbi:porin [Oleisolibacter albus]|uniref:porin n=1 Tax=Oleisolibacter albus TaxID=2171757 RepID=UPI000DF3369B|nr:porin [Oleisolibacter albus]
MAKNTLLAGTILGAAILVPGLAAAQSAPTPTAAQIDALNRQIQALQSQLDTLKDSVGKDIKAVDKKLSEQTTVTVANGRPRFVSPDKAFDVSLRGRIHLDYGYWTDSKNTGDLADGFNFRRAFLGIGGKVFNDWVFDVNTDFATGGANRGSNARLQAANFSYTGFKNWSIDFGAMQPSLTLMDSIGSNDIPFIEKSQTTNLAVMTIANEARLSAGFRQWGERYRISAYVTGDQISNSGPRDDQAAVIGRASVLAATGDDYKVHLGVSGGHLFKPGQTAGVSARTYSLSDRPETRQGGLTVGTANGQWAFGTGNIDTKDYTVYGGEFGATYKSFWAMAEHYNYEFSRRNNLSDVGFDSWYVAGGWFLTGEQRPYSVAGGNFGAPKINAPFKLGQGGGIGAWEVAVRYSTADLTDSKLAANDLQGEQDVVTLGVNWYLNNAFRFMLNYSFINVDRPSWSTAKDIDADAITLRAQFAF